MDMNALQFGGEKKLQENRQQMCKFVVLHTLQMLNEDWNPCLALTLTLKLKGIWGIN